MASNSKKVYITPSLMYAFIDRVHDRNREAAAYFRYFAQHNYQLFTDVTDVLDTYNALSSRMSPSVGKDFLRIIFLSDINILYPEEVEIKTALKQLLNYGNEALLYPEALRASIANRRSIPYIATFNYLHALFGLETFTLPI